MDTAKSSHMTMVMILTVVVVCPCMGAAQEREETVLFTRTVEGAFASNQDIPIGIVADAPQCPARLELTHIRFETAYGNSWKVLAGLQWHGTETASWRITVELLDRQGDVLDHPRDEPTDFITVKGTADGVQPFRAEMELGVMHFARRFQTQRFRLRLECLARDGEEGDRQSTNISITDETTQRPLAQAVIVQTSNRLDSWTSVKRLFAAGADGHIRLEIADVRSTRVSLEVQCPGHATLTKGFGTERLPSTHEFSLPVAKKIGGTVYSPGRTPVSDVWITINTSRPNDSGRCYLFRAVKTDGQGQWTFEGIPQGAERVQLEFKHPGYKSLSRHFGGEQVENTETLTPGLTVGGVVRDDRGDPVPDAVVHMLPIRYGRYDDNYMHVLTDDRGQFSFGCGRDDMSEDQSDKGLTLLLVEVPGFVPAIKKVKLAHENPPVNIGLTRGRTVTGKVVDQEGRPVPDAWTIVHPFLQGHKEYGLWQPEADAQGRFALVNMPEHFRLTVGQRGFITIREMPFPRETGEPIIELSPAVRLTGNVTDAATGKPIDAFELALTRQANRRPGQGPRMRWEPFKKGTYEKILDESFTAEYVLAVRANGYELKTSRSFTMAQGDQQLDFALTPDPSYKIVRPQRPQPLAAVKGTVLGPNGTPASGVTISTYGRMADDAVSSADGTFKLVFLMSGEYDQACIIVARDKKNNLAASLPSFDPFKPLEIKLEDGVTLMGKVQDPNGHGLPQAEIVLRLWYSDTGYGKRENVTIDEDGSFVIPAVARDQQYSVDVTAAGHGTDSIRIETYNGESPVQLRPLVLRVADRSIAGVVVDESEQPVANIRIYAYGKGQPHLYTKCDEQGRFLLEGLTPGTVSLQANTREGPRLHGRTRAQAGDQNIHIVAEELDERGRPVPPKPKSLIGKPMPAWEGLGLSLDPATLENKPVLMCFWDMDQRPSRRFVTQLGERAQDLAARTVAVVLVQVTEVEQAKLDQWLADNGIQFTIDTLQGDFQKKRFDWGVKSLPWLVLTDNKHMVRAEGVQLSELDRMLQHYKGD